MATVARQHAAVHPFVAYRRILVPVDAGGPAAVVTACTLATDSGAEITALRVIEVPAALPLDAEMPEDPKGLLAVAEAIGDGRGVHVDRVAVRARRAGEAIVAAAEELDSELIVLRRELDRTARYVLKHARCRVLFSRP